VNVFWVYVIMLVAINFIY